MAIYPGAVYKPTGFGGRSPRNKQGRGVLHVAVSRARSLPPWNANTWHLYVADDGYCEQYVDTDFRAYAAADANDDAILIETAGGLGSSAALNAERWTSAAAERLADIMAWESQQPGGAPLELLPDSKPGRRGWGPHRLGIQHSRGVGTVPGWLVPGGERWSSAIGKECPGDAKVAQIPALIARAKEIAAGIPAPVIDPRGPEMRVLRVKENGRMYTATDTEVAYIGDPAVAASATATWGEAKEVSQREADLLSFDANARRARLRAEIVAAVASQISGTDVDEQALGQAVIAGLLPQLTTAFAVKTGLTREDVEQVVRGVFSDAAGS